MRGRKARLDNYSPFSIMGAQWTSVNWVKIKRTTKSSDVSLLLTPIFYVQIADFSISIGRPIQCAQDTRTDVFHNSLKLLSMLLI